MAVVARTICQAVWSCTTCVVNNCLFLISEDKTSGCFSSIVGRPQVTRQLETLEDCERVMGDKTNDIDSVGDYSNDVAEILGSGTVGVVIGVLVTLAVCCFFLRRRQQRQNQDPEMIEPGEVGRADVNGNYSPRNILRAIGNGIRVAALASRVVRQISRLRQRQNDEVPLVPNEVVEHPVELESPHEQRAEAGGHRGHGNFNRRSIFRAAGTIRGVGSLASEIGRRISQMRRRQDDQVPLVHDNAALGIEGIPLENLGCVEHRAADQNQVEGNQVGNANDPMSEPRQPLMDPNRRSPIRDLFEDGIEDQEMAQILNSSQLVLNTATSSFAVSVQRPDEGNQDDGNDDNEDNLSDSTGSTILPADYQNVNDLEDDIVSVTTESTDVSVEEPNVSGNIGTMELPAGNQEAVNVNAEFEEVDLEEHSEAASSFSIGSSESTPSRRIQPSRSAKNESREMMKALHKHNLI